MYPAFPNPRLLTAEEVHVMAEAGILGPEERVELIDGTLVTMSPKGNAHVQCLKRLTRLFTTRLYASEAPPAEVIIQDPVRLTDDTEPEPDLTLLQPGTDHLPRPEDVLLVVEVSDTTLAYDRDVKLPRYAAAGIPEVWIVALPETCVYVYRRPEGGRYAIALEKRGRDELGISGLPDIEPMVVRDMLPAQTAG